jgi:hypothetical protein
MRHVNQTRDGIIQALTFKKPVLLADVIWFARKDWPHLKLVIADFGFEPSDKLEHVKTRLRNEVARDKQRRETGHWSYSADRAIATSQFLALIERFAEQGVHCQKPDPFDEQGWDRKLMEQVQ